MVIAQTYNGIISYCFGHLLYNSSFFTLGLYDMTMLRFLPDQRVGFREYMRSDGTLSYFFTLDTVRELFHAAGLIEVPHSSKCSLGQMLLFVSLTTNFYYAQFVSSNLDAFMLVCRVIELSLFVT